MADGADRFFNRELSWLQFNSRVLAQAEDPQLPLLKCSRNMVSRLKMLFE